MIEKVAIRETLERNWPAYFPGQASEYISLCISIKILIINTINIKKSNHQEASYSDSVKIIFTLENKKVKIQSMSLKLKKRTSKACNLEDLKITICKYRK